MTSLRQVAIKYAAILASSDKQDHLFTIRVTKKGGLPAQTAKRIILTRLAAAPNGSSLIHDRGDAYRYLIQDQPTRFRFAVTTSTRGQPWFNTSLADLERLSQKRAIILVIWNPSPRENRRLTVFAVPTDKVAHFVRLRRRPLLISLLRATRHKLENDSAKVPGLLDTVRTAYNVEDIHSDIDNHELNDLHATIKCELTKYLDSIDLNDKRFSPAEATAVVTKLRQKLDTLLLQIKPSTDRSNEYDLVHTNTGSTLLHLPPSLAATVELGEFEAGIFQQAYIEVGGGVEEDEQPDSTEPIAQPYDPTKSKIDTRLVTVDLLARRLRENEIDLAPPFQRKAGLWSAKQKSQLIESLLIRIPLPAFYFDATDTSRWVVVDGLQRLTAFDEFLNHQMPLKGLEYLINCNGKSFSDLPRPLRRDIEESQLTLHLIQPGTPGEVKFNIFRRVNTGGLVLSAQEIRHALNQGPAVSLLQGLAGSQEFLRATGGSIPTERMADREFVLRFLAFTISSYREYAVADLDLFLNSQMGKLNKVDQRYSELRKRFTIAMDTAHALFGRHAFRKLYQLNQARSPINKALFETWSVTLGSLSASEILTLISRKDTVVRASIKLLSDQVFYKAISQGTSDVAKVKQRFRAIEGLVEHVCKEP